MKLTDGQRDLIWVLATLGGLALMLILGEPR